MYNLDSFSYRLGVVPVPAAPQECGPAGGDDVTDLFIGISVLSVAVAVAAVVLGMLAARWCSLHRQCGAGRGETKLADTWRDADKSDLAEEPEK